MNTGSCSDPNKVEGWKQLWRLDVPNKVKIFLWRLCRNNISVRNLLRSRGVQTPIICPMCGVDIEHLLHLFLDCNFAKDCWSVMGVQFDVLQVEEAPT